MSTSSPNYRCAVYTRKSTDEGLDQAFNSLDAQRDACVAYIASQAGLGWTLVPDRYDDGGISGGTMERPALQRLLEDIRQRRVDVVVVYKIDRLTRSLLDFSKMVEIFDAAGASFVAVTQQFNTTTSMGRLTLNVLLSFAQFEREVTAERIRDKIAASKSKGMWMGGTVPLGYRAENRRLVIDEEEARTVRHLFDRYLELKSVPALAEEAVATGLSRRAAKEGMPRGKPFGRGNLYHLLSNPIYIGKVRHRNSLHQGEHEPVVDGGAFERAQALLAKQAPRRASPKNNPDVHLLTGILFDEMGDRLSPTHAKKGNKRYRYYISNRLQNARRKGRDGQRIPAAQIEAIVESQLERLFRDQAQLTHWMQEAGDTKHLGAALEEAAGLSSSYWGRRPAEKAALLTAVFQRIDVANSSLTFRVDRGRLLKLLLADLMLPAEYTSALPPLASVDVTIPITLRKRGVETRMAIRGSTSSSPDSALISLLARAHLLLRKLTDGTVRSLSEVAAETGVGLSEVSQILPLAFLSPDLVEASMTGMQPSRLRAQLLLRWSDLPAYWQAQEQRLQQARFQKNSGEHAGTEV